MTDQRAFQLCDYDSTYDYDVQLNDSTTNQPPTSIHSPYMYIFTVPDSVMQ